MSFSTEISALFIKSQNNPLNNQLRITNMIKKSYPMPQIEGIAAWLNSEPITQAQLKNKVVLIDFWTYSCINCIRTLPYLKSWYEKYHNLGLIIIGIHSPEFDFEKKPTNVKKAITSFGIKYPVALDNNFVTWRNFDNSYWPAHFLVDKNGNVVYQHFGEGKYDETENNIRALLGMNAVTIPQKKSPLNFQTPETYFGYERANRNSSLESQAYNQNKKYTYPESLSADAWALNGDWTIEGQRIIANEANASIKINFRAAKVYAVMGSESNQPITVRVYLNGKPAPISSIVVENHTLYTVIDEKNHINGLLELIATTPGLEMYTFTFSGD